HETVYNDFSNATELADYLVNKGVPFRNAHEIVGKIVLWSIQHNVYLLDVPLEEYQNAHPSIEADIFDYFKPENCVSRRISYGSNEQGGVKQQLKIITIQH